MQENELLKYKLADALQNDNLTDSMFRIQAMDINSRL